MEVQTTEFGKVEVVLREYSNGRTAIQLIDPMDGEPITTLTVNLPEEPLKPGEFFIKGWSENEEICGDCRRSGLFHDTGRRVQTGWVQAEVWRFK